MHVLRQFAFFAFTFTRVQSARVSPDMFSPDGSVA